MILAKIQTPLNSKKNCKRFIRWSEETVSTFEQCKTELANGSLLAYPENNAPLSLTTDKSDTGDVLHQSKNNTLQPIGFFLRKLFKSIFS